MRWEREIKPKTLAKDYINMLWKYFTRAISKKKKISIISYRHWDKNAKGELSEKWEIQAKELWIKLNNEIDKKWYTILAATHNVINESIIYSILLELNYEIPKEWEKPLDFTETVKYTFNPSEENGNPYMEIEWRNKKVEIPYKRFKELVENLTK